MTIDELLLNVRRAIRLLATYNKRVLDIVRLVERMLEAEPDGRFKFRWLDPASDAPGKRSTNPLGYDEWAFLPFADVSFEWSTDKKNTPEEPGSVNVFVRFVADSAYMESDDGDPAEFPAAEECESRLEIRVLGLARGSCQESWDALFDAADEGGGFEQRMGNPVEALALGDLDTSDDALVYLKDWRVPLALLTSEEAVEEQILNPLRTALREVVNGDGLEDEAG